MIEIRVVANILNYKLRETQTNGFNIFKNSFGANILNKMFNRLKLAKPKKIWSKNCLGEQFACCDHYLAFCSNTITLQTNPGATSAIVSGLTPRTRYNVTVSDVVIL